ncbi:MAG: manganese efflux pump [Candidatus Eremiobacteraeota bacterium]|nr:manganese efflux pump [Candidatus Eremiobacteraeota bacterium]
MALSLGLDVFAVSVGVGMRGVPRSTKIRIGIAFATAEVTMNLIGVALGAALGKVLGDIAGYIGFAALFGLGCYMIYESRREAELRQPLDMSRGWGLFIASLSISLDSLGIGFSILYIGVPLVLSLAIIAVTSVASTVLGLVTGRALGRRAEENAELWAGIVLALTGLVFAAVKFFHIGA